LTIIQVEKLENELRGVEKIDEKIGKIKLLKKLKALF